MVSSAAERMLGAALGHANLAETSDGGESDSRPCKRMRGSRALIGAERGRFLNSLAVYVIGVAVV